MLLRRVCVERKRSRNGVLGFAINHGPPRIFREPFLLQPRRERGDVACWVIVDSLQHVDQVGRTS